MPSHSKLNCPRVPTTLDKINPLLSPLHNWQFAMGLGLGLGLTTTTDQEESPASGDGSSASVVRTAETLLRLAPMGLCLAAMVVMLKNSEENDYGSVSYSNLTPFTYLVSANAICAAYSLLSAFFFAAAASSSPRPALSRAWAVFLLDQVLTYVILAAGAVSAEIIYLAYNGDERATWSRECGVFDGFCKKATTSVGITFGAVVCYVMLSLVSSYRLFSAYEAPIPFLGGKGVEIAAFPR